MNSSNFALVRSNVYSLLSSAYIQAPDILFVTKLRGKEISSILRELSSGIGFPEEMDKGFADLKRFITSSNRQTLERACKRLLLEYTRLFRGIKPVHSPPPPYESVYMSMAGNLMGKTAIEVRNKYAEMGISLPCDCKELPDHIGIELDFMRFLTGKESEAWEKEEQGGALNYLYLERDFLEEHITKWIPKFCDRVIDLAELGFYRGIARITKGYVLDDLEKVNYTIKTLKNHKIRGK